MKEDLIYICEICQSVLEEHHCKAICPNCGRTFDCSDLPVMQANAKIENEHLIPNPGNGMKDLLPATSVEADRSPNETREDASVADLP